MGDNQDNTIVGQASERFTDENFELKQSLGIDYIDKALFASDPNGDMDVNSRSFKSFSDSIRSALSVSDTARINLSVSQLFNDSVSDARELKRDIDETSDISQQEKAELQNLLNEINKNSAGVFTLLSDASDHLGKKLDTVGKSLSPEEAVAFTREFLDHHDLTSVTNEGKTVYIQNPDLKEPKAGDYVPKPEAFAPGNMLEQSQQQQQQQQQNNTVTPPKPPAMGL